MGKYGKNMRDCCDSLKTSGHIKGCPLATVTINITISDCFDNNGMIKFDPYRFDDETATPYAIAVNDLLFTDAGWLRDRRELRLLIEANKKKWKWSCDAIGLYHAEQHASATKGSYPTYYYFR